MQNEVIYVRNGCGQTDLGDVHGDSHRPAVLAVPELASREAESALVGSVAADARSVRGHRRI